MLLGEWGYGLGRAAEPTAQPTKLPPRMAALHRWYDFLDAERDAAKRAVDRGRMTQQDYGLRLDTLGELEAALAHLAGNTGP